jgi:type I restriction enzyme S subunit
LPPLAEQNRIVAKIAALLEQTNAARVRLANVPTLLKRFRQSVLVAACSGRLTEEWRDKQRKPETAENLIKTEQYSMLEPEGGFEELPEGWIWTALGNYGRCSRGRFSVRPRNDPAYYDGPHPFIQIGDLPPEGGWIASHRQTLNDRGLAVSKKFPVGTAVIAIVGATIGNTGLLAYDMCFPDSIIGIETGTEEGNRYIELYLRHKKLEIRNASYSSGGQPNIKLEVLNPYPLALPPLDEQREIVGRVEALFALADRIQNRVRAASVQAERLPQAVLSKAFRGELVPTEAELAAEEGRDYESATALLERIQESRKQTKPAKRGGGGNARVPFSHITEDLLPAGKITLEDLKPAK